MVAAPLESDNWKKIIAVDAASILMPIHFLANMVLAVKLSIDPTIVLMRTPKQNMSSLYRRQSHHQNQNQKPMIIIISFKAAVMHHLISVMVQQ